MTYKEIKEAIERLPLDQQNLEAIVDITGEEAILIELRVFEGANPLVKFFADWDI